MPITYRLLRGYKYELVDAAEHPSSILRDTLNPVRTLIQTKYGRIDSDGRLVIYSGYAWDGPSGIAIDSPTGMKGSLFHDFLYQLMREGFLSRSYRDAADRLLQSICLENGMSKIRAYFWYLAVKSFSKRSAYPETNPRGRIVTV